MFSSAQAFRERTFGSKFFTCSADRATVSIFSRNLKAVLDLAIACTYAHAISCSQPETTSEITFPQILEGKDPSLVALVRKSLRAANSDPRDQEVWLRLGFVYEANGLDSLALTTYDRALAVADTSARAWYRIFTIGSRQGNLVRAAAANAQTLKLAPSYAPLHIRSGFWHLDLDRRLQARRAFERSIELDPGNPGGYWGLARIMMLDDEPEHAVALLERLLRNRPNDPYTFQLLGNAYRQVGQWQKAQVALGKAKGGGPTWPDPWHQEVIPYETSLMVEVERVRAFIARGIPQLAVVELQKLRQLHPESLIVLKMLGKALVLTAQWEKALEVHAQAQSKHPEDAELFQSIASVYFGMGDTDRAISQLELALAIDSTLASAHAGRGSILMQERQLRQAAAAFQRASVFEPNNPAHLVQLGMVQCELQEWAAGRDSFRGAVAIDSMQHAGYLGWAVAARGMQNLEEAERVLLRAVALMPESNTVNSLLQAVRRQRSEAN